MTGSVRSLLLFLGVVVVPLAVLVVLAASDFFVAWEGHVVGVRPVGPDDPRATVRIVDVDGAVFERRWPLPFVEVLDLPADAGARVPDVGPDAPVTTKRRFALFALVERPDGFAVLSTTTPYAVPLAVAFGLLVLALRNMAVSGRPWSIEPRTRLALANLARSGQVVAPHAPRPKPGPPPPRPRVGRGRR